MSKSNVFEEDFLKLIFNGTGIPNLADNASASPLTNLYIALHTADPGEAGGQSTSEVAYTGYGRVAIARTNAGWVVTGNSVSPAAAIEFGEMTAGAPGVATHMTVGTASSGAGKVLYRGTITPNIPYSVGTVPRLRQTTVITED